MISDQPGAVDHRGLCPAMRHSWALETSSSQPGSRDSGEMTFFGHFWINYSKRPIRYNILIDRIIKVRMKFGDTEIKATALDLATGQVPQITNPSFHCFDPQIQCSLPIFLTNPIYPLSFCLTVLIHKSQILYPSFHCFDPYIPCTLSIFPTVLIHKS